jgi:DNA helicase II / ATP-dependent DNA helicase PcrA
MFKNEHESINLDLGGHLHELEGLLFDYWSALERIGLSDGDIVNLDWGKPNDIESKTLHSTIQRAFSIINQRYNALKMEKNAISIGDIVLELRRIFENGEIPTLKSRPIKYLFVDEFQDSDNVQINTIAWLMKAWKFKLFVVGDIKQSIYRFRGATATAFDKLVKELNYIGEESPTYFSLIRNYRTSKDILDELDQIFNAWRESNLLKYDNPVSAQKKFSGSINIEPLINKESIIKDKTIAAIKSCIIDCCKYSEENCCNSKVQKVTVLTRTNKQLEKIADWCHESQIPCYIHSEGTFFASRAVRDFMAMIRAYVLSNDSIAKYNYLMSAYGSGLCSIEALQKYESGSDEQRKYLDGLLSYVSWESNKRDFRLKPVLSVIRKILDTISPVENFIALRKGELKDWSKVDMETQVYLEAQVYEANTNKLMQLIRTQFSGEFTSLYQIYRYLLINIQSNRTEEEPDISSDLGPEVAYGMTVHGAKGLEFDTVIIPFTNRVYRREEQTEILVDDASEIISVGWGYIQTTGDSRGRLKCNSNYSKAVEREFGEVTQEEARLLYVAVTRCIRTLICFVEGSNKYSWAKLLGEIHV